MVARVLFPGLPSCRNTIPSPPTGDHQGPPISIKLRTSPSTSVGARAVRRGGVGLHGRPRPVPPAPTRGRPSRPNTFQRSAMRRNRWEKRVGGGAPFMAPCGMHRLPMYCHQGPPIPSQPPSPLQLTPIPSPSSHPPALLVPCRYPFSLLMTFMDMPEYPIRVPASPTSARCPVSYKMSTGVRSQGTPGTSI